jgi:hypothetical protein
MKAIQRAPETEENSFSSAVLDLPAGAHLRIKSTKIWPPKFHDESGALMPAAIVARMVVVDDFGDGTYDGLEFDDRFDLKPHPSLGFDLKRLKDATIRDFTEEEQAQLLDEDNWTVGRVTKADNLNICHYGPSWEQEISFHPEKHWVGKEFIAKVKKRTGKKAGSYCGWDTFIATERPKNNKKKGGTKSKIQKAQEEEAQQVELSAEDEKLMEEAPSS